MKVQSPGQTTKKRLQKHQDSCFGGKECWRKITEKSVSHKPVDDQRWRVDTTATAVSDYLILINF